MTLDIGILLSNTDESDFARQFENDALKTATLLRRQRPDWRYTIYATINGKLPASPDAHHGYLITGSPASVNRSEPWMPALFDFIRAAHQQAIPMAGLCFGHQAIAHALGGRVEQMPQWGLGVAATQFDYTPAWMQPKQEQLHLHAAHEDQVVQLPVEATRLGGSEFCRIASFSIGKHVFTTQYHPEFPREFMRALVREKIGPKLGSAVADEALDQLQHTTQEDADLFARWTVQFLEQAQP